ncbi:hypothetical protein [Thioclava sp.]|uniref:hypothetical protein n=1 Tax=Thioclava sp. TaxID=1933450 RepID=UPI003AA80CA8
MTKQIQVKNGKITAVQAKDVTHSGGRGEPFHDWFPYLEGYSSQFVKQIIDAKFENPKNLLEPFCGVGTTPIALAQLGISCGYTEVNPFLVELVSLKTICLRMKPSGRIKAAETIQTLKQLIRNDSNTAKSDTLLKTSYSGVFGVVEYFRENSFKQILRLKTLERKLECDLSKRFMRIAVSTSLLEASLLRRAGDVRFKTEKELLKPIPDILELVTEKLSLIQSDLNLNGLPNEQEIVFLGANAKQLHTDAMPSFDGVITSPPYLNGTNYIRNMKLELWYLGFLNSKVDLQKFRQAVVTSAINDVSRASGLVVLDEARDVVEAISQDCYDKRIPKMVAGYFEHMKIVAEGIWGQVRSGSPVCIDIGDSIYGGVHVPTHSVLAAVFESVGFKLEDETVLRKRHSNRGAELSQRLLVFRK